MPRILFRFLGAYPSLARHQVRKRFSPFSVLFSFFPLGWQFNFSFAKLERKRVVKQTTKARRGKLLQKAFSKGREKKKAELISTNKWFFGEIVINLISWYQKHFIRLLLAERCQLAAGGKIWFGIDLDPQPTIKYALKWEICWCRPTLTSKAFSPHRHQQRFGRKSLLRNTLSLRESCYTT